MTHLRPFNEVIGIDPSQSMLDKARVYLAEDKLNSPIFKLLHGSAEDMKHHLSDESVDLLIAGIPPLQNHCANDDNRLFARLAQACHWFDWRKVWPETNRVLCRGGSASFWVCFHPCKKLFVGLNLLPSGLHRISSFPVPFIDAVD